MRFVDFDGPKFLPYGNRKISLSTEDEKPIRFQIPRLYMPFGLSGFTPNVGPTKWNIDFSLKGHDEPDNYVKKFYDFLQALDVKVIDHVHSLSVDIFGKQLSYDEISAMYNSNLKEGGSNREPKFRVKVDMNTDGTIKPEVFDSNNEDVTTTATSGLYARHSGVAIVELNSVYFMNKMFGLTWKVHQLKVHEPQRLKGFQFILNDA